MLLFQKPMEGRRANPKPTAVRTELPANFDMDLKILAMEYKDFRETSFSSFF